MRCMEKDDARYSTLEQLHERRKQVVRLHRKGYGVMQIVELSGLSYPTVRGAIDLYEGGGMGAIKPATRGKRAGQGRTLTEEQEHAIRQIICDKRPEQLKMGFALWSRAAVMQLIEQECGIKLSVRGVGNYLSRWGFTPQKPIKKAYEQRPEAVQAWLDEHYPEIENRCHRAHDQTRAITGACHELLPRHTRQICRVKLQTSSSRINKRTAFMAFSWGLVAVDARLYEHRPRPRSYSRPEPPLRFGPPSVG